MKTKNNKRETRRHSGGRKRGQRLWVHNGIEDDLSNHFASHGDFSPDVNMAAFYLGGLVKRYEEARKSTRYNLEANRREVTIPLPMLPGDLDEGLKTRVEEQVRKHWNLVRKDEFGEKFLKEETEAALATTTFDELHLRYLRETAHDAIWAMQGGGFMEGLRLLSALIQAAANNDGEFFKELHRRICCAAPLQSPVEQVTSALLSLKKCYKNWRWSEEHEGPFYEREMPELAKVLKCPPGQRPPLTVPQMAEWVWLFGKIRVDGRTLKRHADAIELTRKNERGRPHGRQKK